MPSFRSVPALLAASMLCSTAALAGGQITVVFNDPGASYAGFYTDIERNALAAGDAWLASFADFGTETQLTVSIGFSPVSTANGRSAAAAWVGPGAGGIALYEQGAAHELRTGIDVNGAAPDIEINLGINGYLQNELWFDPDPGLRLAVVPFDRTDAMSVFLHEYGHAFGFNGWRDATTGALPGAYASTFDALLQPAQGLGAGALWLTSPAAMAQYGGPVPLTVGNYAHLGNRVSGLGTDLLPDLMNGVVFYRGTRYAISALDLAVMQDLGLPLAASVPEPATAPLLLAGLAGLLALRHLKRAAAAA